MALLNYLGSIKGYLQDDSIGTEGSVFKLAWKSCTVMLLTSSILLTASEMIGPPIICMTDLDPRILAQYCWVSSTFTLPDYHMRQAVSEERYLHT